MSFFIVELMVVGVLMVVIIRRPPAYTPMLTTTRAPQTREQFRLSFNGDDRTGRKKIRSNFVLV